MPSLGRDIGRLPMGVALRKYKGKWYLFINHLGKRKAKCVGTDRKVAEEIKRKAESRLAMGDLGITDSSSRIPNFAEFSERWMRDYAQVECKKSTAEGYESVLNQYLLPRLGNKRLDAVTREHAKDLITDFISPRPFAQYNSQRLVRSARNLQ